MALVGSRHGQHQVDQHASVELQVANRISFDHLTNTGVSSSQHIHAFTLNVHGAAERREMEGHITGSSLPDFEMQGLSQRRKSRGLGGKLILFRKQTSDFINSLLVAGDLSNRARANGHELYGGAGNCLALRIKNGAGQARIVALTQTNDLTEKAANSEQDCS